MGLSVYLANNILEDADGFTMSSEDTAYPIANAYDEEAANPVRWASISAATVEADISVTGYASMFALINHNLTSAATIVLKAGNSSPASNVLSSPAWRQYDLYGTFSGVTYRYWRLEITDTNPNNIAIGEIKIGTKVTLNAKPTYGFTQGRRYGKVEQETERGAKYRYNLFTRVFKEYQYATLLDSHIAEFDTLDQVVLGDGKPFVFVPNEDLDEVLYVRKQTGHVMKNRTYNQWEYTLELEAESRGINILE
jgi:hypothetical protein